MDPTLKAPFVQGSRERCPGPTRQEPFVAYCSFSLRSPPPGSPTWSYRKLWSYRCPRPFTLCLPSRLYTARGGGVQGPHGRNHLAHVLSPSLSTTGVSSPPTQRGPPGTNHVSTTTSRSPSQEALFPPAHPRSRVRGTHQVWSNHSLGVLELSCSLYPRGPYGPLRAMERRDPMDGGRTRKC